VVLKKLEIKKLNFNKNQPIHKKNTKNNKIILGKKIILNKKLIMAPIDNEIKDRVKSEGVILFSFIKNRILKAPL
jgi:hypothetical protein